MRHAAEHATPHATSHATAPPVTREWPSPRPTPRALDWPAVIVAALMIAAVLLALPTALALTDPLAGDLCYALAALLALYLAYGMLVEGVHRGWGLWRARRRLGRAGGPGELREVATRLRGMDVGQGRARLCRDVAVRCLEGDARFGGLEGRLRREAKRWKWIMM